jgi:signal transduction histidine kinase
VGSVSSASKPPPAAPPRRAAFPLTLRIYLVTLLPFVITGLVVGAVDLSTGVPPRPSLHFLLMPLGLLLLLVAIALTFFARSLAKPISRLTQTAAAFGAGDLGARTGLQRKDELGELAAVFDEMADRIAVLMRAQKKLLANVSHELRTPLARIRVALDIVDAQADEGSRPELRSIAEDLQELEQLVANILITARLDLEAGDAGLASLALNVEPVESRSIVEAAVARFGDKSPSRRLEVEIETPLPLIDADRVLLRRVIDNLLDNARKYSAKQSLITLRATGTEEALSVAVEDHGIGISQADLDRLFTPFFRTDDSRARTTGGVGLGLSLSRQIVEAHGGTIAIDSEVGRGTVVRFTIPANRFATATADDPSPPAVSLRPPDPTQS